MGEIYINTDKLRDRAIKDLKYEIKNKKKLKENIGVIEDCDNIIEIWDHMSKIFNKNWGFKCLKKISKEYAIDYDKFSGLMFFDHTDFKKHDTSKKIIQFMINKYEWDFVLDKFIEIAENAFNEIALDCDIDPEYVDKRIKLLHNCETSLEVVEFINYFSLCRDLMLCEMKEKNGLYLYKSFCRCLECSVEHAH